MKRKLRSALSVLLIFIMTLTVFSGCGQTEQTPVSVSTDGVREITDMAGRTMEVPENIEKIFSTDPTAGIYIYTADPDRLLGWNYELNDLEKKIILPEYHDLPSFGMGDSINYEAVIAAAPEIALMLGGSDETTKEEADSLSDSLGIPVVVVSDELKDAAEVYRFLGDLLGVEDETEKMAQFAEKTFNDVEEADITDAEKVTVYYGNGENSLETAPNGSSHAQIFDMVKAINVADLEAGEGGRVQISAEQLLAWDPDYIVLNGEPKQDLSGMEAIENMKNNPEFKTLQAVRNDHLLAIPNTPFSWFDRPPGPNRIIGIRWLAREFYPDKFDYDLKEEIKEFYNLFYHVDLSDEQLNEIVDLSE